MKELVHNLLSANIIIVYDNPFLFTALVGSPGTGLIVFSIVLVVL